MKSLLAHDSVTVYGGAERTLEALVPLFPEAPLYTAIFRPRGPLPAIASRSIRTSALQHLPLPVQLLKPLFPLAFETLRVDPDVELVLSSSSGYAKGIRPPTGAVHISYVHTPLRRVWNPYHRQARRIQWGRAGRAVEAGVLAWLRRWDLASMKRVDHLVANSKNTALQIQRVYGREAVVVHPPVRTSFFVPPREETAGQYFLVVGRLDPYKRVDLAVRAASKLRLPLVIVGDGVERSRLEPLADTNVTFLGVVDDTTLRTLYQGCRALLFPGEEDFGIVPVEAQACGKPVVALSAGGALETVIEGVTGLFFPEQSPDSLVQAIEKLEGLSFDRARIRQHAEQFDERHFSERLLAFIRRTTGRSAWP